MADYPKQFEAWWAKADDEMKKGMACAGFSFLMLSLTGDLSRLVLKPKKEEP